MVVSFLLKKIEKERTNENEIIINFVRKMLATPLKEKKHCLRKYALLS
jgi:hypothetical protein